MNILISGQAQATLACRLLRNKDCLPHLEGSPWFQLQLHTKLLSKAMSSYAFWVMLTITTALQLAIGMDDADLWQEALQHHGWLATNCKAMQSEAMQASMKTTGFHGQVQYALDQCQLALFDQCQLTVLQLLPAGLYADPYELQNLMSASGGDHGSNLQMSAFRTFGSVDVEKIESDCNATVLSVSAQFKLPSHKDNLYPCQHSVLSLPLHARYPVPSLQPLPGVVSLLLGTHHQYNVADPAFTVECARPAESKADCFASAQRSTRMQLHWTVPAGGLWHAQFVLCFTAITAVCGLCVLLKTIVVK